MIDWGQLWPAKENGGKVNPVEEKLFDDVIWIPDDQVIPRVHHTRTGSNFFDAISCGQILSRRVATNSEVDAIVHYHPEEQKLTFTHLSRYFAPIPAVYWQQSFVQDGGEIQTVSDIGLIKDDLGLNFTGRSLFGRSEPERVFSELSDYAQYAAVAWVSYHALLRDEGVEFMRDEEALEKDLQKYRDLAQLEDEYGDHFSEIIERYETIKQKYGEFHGRRFIDFDFAQMEMAGIAPTSNELFSLMGEKIGFNDATEFFFLYVGMALKEMAEVTSVKRSMMARDILCSQLSERTGLPFYGAGSEGLLTSLRRLQNNSLTGY
tara:strand:- start:409 stop:1368 length:960 start_codon:yes stop_codon:yes gene_type:complete